MTGTLLKQLILKFWYNVHMFSSCIRSYTIIIVPTVTGWNDIIYISLKHSCDCLLIVDCWQTKPQSGYNTYAIFNVFLEEHESKLTTVYN